MIDSHWHMYIHTYEDGRDFRQVLGGFFGGYYPGNDHMADFVVVMYAGLVVEQGTVEEIFYHPAHPYTIGLMASKPVVGKPVDRLFAIGGVSSICAIHGILQGIICRKEESLAR